MHTGHRPISLAGEQKRWLAVAQMRDLIRRDAQLLRSVRVVGCISALEAGYRRQRTDIFAE